MCGIAGLATWRSGAPLRADLERMTEVLVHRGPDDAGHWCDEGAGIALGQRRLAVIDVSPAGHQPMLSASGRYVLSYNGEIYNFAGLRKRLLADGNAPPWRGHSDTEVLLACIEAWGTEAALVAAHGMFAVSLWDRQTGTLTLARDRLGEKPLYYGRIGERLAFASEPKALRALPDADLRTDPQALALFMQFGYVPAPLSIHGGIRKLPPGHWLQLRSPADAETPPKPFWRATSPQVQALRAEMSGASDAVLIERLERQLSSAVAQQMVADVPLGAFLSGGVDSSAVVALMQQHCRQPVRTFTIGFDQPGYDEAPFARAVARHLGTDHTELYVEAGDAQALIPRLPAIYDEPFADSSQIPTTLVAQLTRQHVTVSLSGDGGDELFAGYPRYGLAERLWHRAGRVPRPARLAAAAGLRLLSPRAWDRLFTWAGLAHGAATLNGRRMHRLASLVQAQDLCEMYLRLMSQTQPEDGLVTSRVDADWARRHWEGAGADGVAAAPLDAMRLWDLRQHLPDDLLVKVDRASMSASLEARAPLLDPAVVELAFALPARMLVRNGVGKWALRQVLYRHVPPALIERPKAGFSVPLAAWLRGPLRDWAETLLSPAALASDPWLHTQRIRGLWQQHLAGRFDHSSALWNVLMYRAWAVAQGPGAACPTANFASGMRHS